MDIQIEFILVRTNTGFIPRVMVLQSIKPDWIMIAVDNSNIESDKDEGFI